MSYEISNTFTIKKEIYDDFSLLKAMSFDKISNNFLYSLKGERKYSSEIALWVEWQNFSDQLSNVEISEDEIIDEVNIYREENTAAHQE